MRPVPEDEYEDEHEDEKQPPAPGSYGASAIHLPAYPSTTTRCKAPSTRACRRLGAILAPLRGDLCTILYPNFRESIFHALG